MGAICKTIPIHGSTTVPLLKYCGDKDKTSVSRNLQKNPDLNISDALNYAANPLKTICNVDEDHKEILITGIKCDPNTAAQEFAIARNKYLDRTGRSEYLDPFDFLDRRTGELKTVQKQPVIALHLIQSFQETDLDPHIVHQIGVDLAERLGVMAVVDTHLNKEHLHNHIIINTYMDNGKKFLDNLENRIAIRELSDRIQKEYGIDITFDTPKEQLKASHEKMSYKEWEAEAMGVSWKDAVRQDISTVASIAGSREEYLSIMEAYGYKVKAETPDSVTFIVPETEKAIRDTSLGKEYAIGQLYKVSLNAIERQRPKYQKLISIARYDRYGRRRSDLELFLRKAIAIIQKILNHFRDPSKSNCVSPSQKIRHINEAIEICLAHNITTEEELGVRIDKTGAELSHYKAELKKIEAEKPLYKVLQEAAETIEQYRQVDTNIGNLSLHSYDKDTVQHNRSNLAPLSPTLKSDLAVALFNHPDYKLTCKYTDMIPSEAVACIDFLNGRNSEKPNILCSLSEFGTVNALKLADKIYQSKLQHNRDTYKDRTPSSAALKTAKQLLAEHGLESDIELSMFEVMDINNCLGRNPFEGKLIDEEKQKELDDELKKQNLQITRPIEFVLEDEYNYLMRYLSGKTRSKPDILNEYAPPKESDMQNLHSIMQAKQIYTSVPLDVLSKAEVAKLLSYCVATGRTPAFLTSEKSVDNKEQDRIFYDRIEKYGIEKMMYLSNYRAALNTLRSLGYDISHEQGIGNVLRDIKAYEKRRTECEEKKEQLGTEYKDFIKLRQTIKNLKNPKYLYGDLYDEKVDKPIEVEVTEEKEPPVPEKDSKSR